MELYYFDGQDLSLRDVDWFGVKNALDDDDLRTARFQPIMNAPNRLKQPGLGPWAIWHNGERFIFWPELDEPAIVFEGWTNYFRFFQFAGAWMQAADAALSE